MTADDQTLKGFNRAEIADALNIARRSVARRAARENWPYTEVETQGGKRRLYRLIDLPESVQTALVRRCASLNLDIVTGQPKPPVEVRARGRSRSNVPKVLPRDEAWARYEKATNKGKEEAAMRLRMLSRVLELCGTGLGVMEARAQVVQEARAEGVEKVSLSSLWRWEKTVKGVPRPDWLALLLPDHHGNGNKGKSNRIEIPEEAMAMFASDYLRPEKPSATSCYARMARAMDAEGKAYPSLDTFERRLKQMVSREALILAREGSEKYERTIPAQERDETVFHAMEAVNMDGHVFDVFVHLPGDETPWRPLGVGAQDVYSRKCLAMQVGKSETSDLVQRAVHEMVREYGIPRHVWFDNGKAFASKQLTGGIAHRNRFKVKPDEPLGVLPALGCEVHFTQPYHGQSKPIERMWRDLEEWISKHPALAGAYVGKNPLAKPENYRSRSVPYATFLQVLKEGIRAHNARRGRRTTACDGTLSFDEAFAASVAQAKVARASDEQLRMLLQATEVVNANRESGMVTVAGNKYWNERLSPYAGQKVQVRFDPEAMQDGVEVYTLEGVYVGFVECMLPVGFNDRDAQRETKRIRKQLKRAKQNELALHRRLDAAELARVQEGLDVAGEGRDEVPGVDALAPMLGKAKRRRQRRERVRDTGLWEPSAEEQAAILRKQEWLRQMDERQRAGEWMNAVGWR